MSVQLPLGGLEALQDAVPEIRLTLLQSVMVVDPLDAVNVTVPEGVPEPGALATTLADKVTGLRAFVVLGLIGVVVVIACPTPRLKVPVEDE